MENGKQLLGLLGKVFVAGLISSATFILASESKKTNKEIHEGGKQILKRMKNK